MFMQLAQQVHGIDPLLDAVFSFMRRKTDFFSGPPGSADGGSMAIKKVLETVNKHAALANQDKLEKEKKEVARKAKKAKKEEAAAAKKLAAAKKEKGEEDVLELGSEGFDVSVAAPVAAPVVDTPPPAPVAASPSAKSDTPSEEKGEDDEEDDGTPAPEGNGGTVENKYVWTQTLQEVNIAVENPLLKGVKGRDLAIKIGKSQISVGLCGKEPIFEGKLCKSVIVDDSFWTLEDGVIAIQLQKLNDMEWWNCVVEGDPTINTQKVRNGRLRLEWCSRAEQASELLWRRTRFCVAWLSQTALFTLTNGATSLPPLFTRVCGVCGLCVLPPLFAHVRGAHTCLWFPRFSPRTPSSPTSTARLARPWRR